jgi:hypothetical protein
VRETTRYRWFATASARASCGRLTGNGASIRRQPATRGDFLHQFTLRFGIRVRHPTESGGVGTVCPIRFRRLGRGHPSHQHVADDRRIRRPSPSGAHRVERLRRPGSSGPDPIGKRDIPEVATDWLVTLAKVVRFAAGLWVITPCNRILCRSATQTTGRERNAACEPRYCVSMSSRRQYSDTRTVRL